MSEAPRKRLKVGYAFGPRWSGTADVAFEGDPEVALHNLIEQVARDAMWVRTMVDEDHPNGRWIRPGTISAVWLEEIEPVLREPTTA